MTPFVPEIAARAKIPKEFLGQASLMHCCLHLHPSSVMISLAEASSGQVVWTESFGLETAKTGNWDEVISFVLERNWFEKVFRKCTLTFDSGDYTVVPQAFFQQGQELALLKFQTGKDYPTADVLALSEFGAHFIFSIPPEIRALSTQFPNIRIFPTAWILARYSWMKSAAVGTSMMLWHTQDMMDMVALKDRKLLVLRNDHIQTPEDILYHASNAAMRLGIDMEHATVFLYALSNGLDAQKLFKGYCREVTIPDEPASSEITMMHISCV